MAMAELENVAKLQDSASYALWFKELEIIHTSLGLSKIVDGTYKKADALPVSTNEEANWIMNDAKAKRHIMRYISEAAKENIMNCDTSNEMMKRLKAVYNDDTDELRTSCSRSSS